MGIVIAIILYKKTIFAMKIVVNRKRQDLIFFWLLYTRSGYFEDGYDYGLER